MGDSPVQAEPLVDTRIIKLKTRQLNDSRLKHHRLLLDFLIFFLRLQSATRRVRKQKGHPATMGGLFFKGE